MNATLAPLKDQQLLTYADLALRWGVCVRQAKRTCHTLRLRPIILGHRTYRFRPADVVRAEERGVA